MDIEIVTVFHRHRNKRQAMDLADTVAGLEPDIEVHLVDNMKKNRGFAKACNLGAAWCKSDIIGFLNPDVAVIERFAGRVRAAFQDPDVVICGNRYGKSDRELRFWGVRHWVCGACMFVRRDWFEAQGGFDERFVWSHEETDLIRQAERDGKRVAELQLPILHESPRVDLDDEQDREDAEYKSKWYTECEERYKIKWRIPDVQEEG